MTTTLSVREETRRRLVQLKMDAGAKSMDELLSTMAIEYRKMRFLEASSLFRRRLRKTGLRFEDLVE